MLTSEEMAYWITEREEIRKNLEGNVPWPYTADPILQKYRFCNVRREDDRVTKWLKKHWRDPYAGHKNMTAAMLLARMINWPPTLAAIGFPDKWQPEKIVKTINGLGGKAWSAAYIVSTCGIPMDKATYVVQTVGKVQAGAGYSPKAGDSLEAVWTRLRSLRGLGAGFIAAQVIADLKNIDGNPLQDADDWWTWAVSGPGSRRGLNRYFRYETKSPWIEREWKDSLATVITEVQPLVHDTVGRIHAQDWQNVLCEYDKYRRVKCGEGKPRKEYRPETAYQV